MVRSSCISACILALLASSSALAQNHDAGASRAGRSPYTVDGLALGARFDAQSPSSRGYQCSASEQFPEFTRCQRTQRQQTGWGRSYDAISSILHSADGKAVYVNRYIGPWMFDRNEIQSEINRLASRFGERGREMRMPQREGLPSGIIASWGQVQLEQLDSDAVAVLASGESPRKGLLIDYLGDLRRSAQLGLPIYSIHGGAGYVWSASAERNGRGHIRYLTVDASAFTPPTEKPQPAAGLNVQANAAEPTAAETPQAQADTPRVEPEKASIDSGLVKAEVENVPVPESAVTDTTEAQELPGPGQQKVEALVARLEAQLARVEATNRRLETWAYRTVAGLVLVLIAAAVLLRVRRKKVRTITARAHKTETRSSPITVPQAVPQFAEQSAPTLVPGDPAPLSIAAETQAKPANPQVRAANPQTCGGCQAQISLEDKFCRHCGTAVAVSCTTGEGSIAVASPSMTCNGHTDAGEIAVQAALFGDAKPA